jgi:hypothetical protein
MASVGTGALVCNLKSELHRLLYSESTGLAEILGAATGINSMMRRWNSE